jgi:UDP-glucose 4-epimerase
VTDYGRTKLLAEDAIRGTKGLAHAILRFPLLYGPHGRGNLERMLRAIARRRYWPIGSPAVRKSCLHLDDAAQALVLAGDHLSAGTYLVAPAEPVTLGELHRAAYEAVGARCPWPAIPSGAARLAAGAVDVAARMLGRPTALERSIATLTSPAWYDGTQFRRLTGFAPRIPLAEGLRGTVRWLRDEGRTR